MTIPLTDPFTKYNLKVCVGPLPGSNAEYWSGGFWWTDKLTVAPRWFTLNTKDYDMFHEISHSQGTADGGDPWNDAHKIENLMTQDKDMWNTYKIAKMDADKAAGVKNAK